VWFRPNGGSLRRQDVHCFPPDFQTQCFGTGWQQALPPTALADVFSGGFPTMAEDIKSMLDTFLKGLPEDGSEEESGTPRVPGPMTTDKIAKAKKEGLKNSPLFERLTGRTHESLLNKWLYDKTTTCNDFCTHWAHSAGYTGEALGRFDIADWLSKRGLDHCWITPGGGAVPEAGDIFRLMGHEADINGVRLNHMGVSVEVSGSEWKTVEAGQGGPLRGSDGVSRKKREWMPASLRGWVSLKAMLNAEQALPYWLGGWWDVKETPSYRWFYHFGANGKVSCTTQQPFSPIMPPSNPTLVGTFKIGPKGTVVTISWNSDDPDEEITFAPDADRKQRKDILIGKTWMNHKLSGKRFQLARADDAGWG
jgi:hypothetical protein